MHYSVLVVDDEVELSEYTAKYFNLSGVETAYVLDAKSALEFFEENTCSLVLLDINLGEDSGFELCRTIRQTMNIPIFFISARSARIQSASSSSVYPGRKSQPSVIGTTRK